MSYIVIDEDRCKGCELCTTVCPQGDLVQMAHYFNSRGYRPSLFVDPDDRCTGCTLCAMMCPDMVITVFRTIRRQRRPQPAASAKAHPQPGRDARGEDS